jgi:hypothetical protein
MQEDNKCESCCDTVIIKLWLIIEIIKCNQYFVKFGNFVYLGLYQRIKVKERNWKTKLMFIIFFYLQWKPLNVITVNVFHSGNGVKSVVLSPNPLKIAELHGVTWTILIYLFNFIQIMTRTYYWRHREMGLYHYLYLDKNYSKTANSLHSNNLRVENEAHYLIEDF